MAKCVNINNPEFKALQEQTGLSVPLLSAKVAIWQDKNNADHFPNANEIVGASAPSISGVDIAFRKYPQLSTVGNQQEYAAYLNSIFPKSAIKDIVYHAGQINRQFPEYMDVRNGELESLRLQKQQGTLEGFDLQRLQSLEEYLKQPKKFDKSAIGLSGYSGLYPSGAGFYFGLGYESTVSEYGEPGLFLVNIKNLLTSKSNDFPAIMDDFREQRSKHILPSLGKDQGYDGVYNDEYDEIAVHEPEQVHFIGTPEDVKAFRDFLTLKYPVSPSYSVLSNAVKDEIKQVYTMDGKEYQTVTNEFMPAMQHKPFTLVDTFGTRQADNFWKDTDKTEKKKFSQFVTAVDYETYKRLVDETYEIGKYKGIIFHKIISNFISGDNTGLSEMYSVSGIAPKEFDWLDAEAIKRIIGRTGTNAYNDNPSLRTDKLIAEPSMVSKIMNVGGTPDLVIDHGGDIFSVFDLKTGKHFDRNFELDFFKYGRAGDADIFVNPRNKAKLQIMLYAMMIKLNNPKARFKNLEVVHVTNRYNIDEIDSARFINTPAYLKMIKSYLQAERPSTYKAMLEASPSIFDTATYNYVSANKYGNKEAGEVLKLKMLELQSLVMFDTNLYKNITVGKHSGKERYVQIAELIKEINELKRDPEMDLKSWDTDMGWMDRWMGTNTASTNPYIKAYYSILSEKKQHARTAHGKWRAAFDDVLNPLIEERTGKPYSKVIGGIDRTKLFEWAYKGTRLYHADDSEFKSFSQAQQNFLNFVNNSVEMFFNDKLANYENIPKGNTALANRVVTFTERAGRKLNVTNLDLFNGKYSNSSRPEFAYYKGFFPKYAPQLYDVARRYSTFSKETLKFIYNRTFTYYYEMVFDKWDASREAIPMKYLDNDHIMDQQAYTLNLELSLDNFVKQNFYKLHMDEVYAYGLGLKLYLDFNKRMENGAEKPRLEAYIEDSVNLHILGKKSTGIDFSGRSFGKVTEEGYKQFSGVKFLRSVKSYFSGVTMWLKPVSGSVNAVFANLVTLKEAARNSFGSKVGNASFGLSHLREGYAEAIGMFGRDAFTGNFRTTKGWLLMEQFGYMPDNVDWYSSKNEMLTANNNLFTTKTLTLFHSLPEEVLATSMFIAQLKAMKTVDKNGNEISMWDAYEVVDGNITYQGGSRGQRSTSNFSDKPSYKEVLGLEIEEVNAMKFLYEKIHGGYRLDERVAAEYYILGELMMQLKRYLPSILKNVWASRGTRQGEGFFKKEVDIHGKEILKWDASIVEGRWRMLLGLLFNRLAIQNSTPGDKGSKIREFFGFQFDESYDWDKLSEQQKEDLKDFAITSALYFFMILAGKSMWDDDDKDTTKKMFYRITDDFGSYVSPIEILKNAINLSAPVTAKKSIAMLDSSSKFFWSVLMYTVGMDDKALTRDGNFRGSKDLQRSIPFISAYHDLYSKMENDSYFQQFLDVRTY